MLQALKRRRHAVHNALNAVDGMGEIVLPQDMVLVVERVVKLGQLSLEPAHKPAGVDVGTGGDGERQDYAGERRMDSGLEEAEPQHEAERHVRREPEVPAPVEHRQCQRDGSGRKKPDRARGMPVEERDGKNGKKVVRDSER